MVLSHVSHCSVARKKDHDQDNSYKTNCLIWGLLTVSESWFSIIMAGTWQQAGDAGEVTESYNVIQM